MATARSHDPKPRAVKLETFVDAEPGSALFAGLGGAAPRARQVDGPALALEQMRLRIEDNLLMVFGPDGDPVPPQAFTAAAAAHPDQLLDLPDGTTAPASRIAAVIHAQVLGRLGRREQGSEWIKAMLRESGRPEPGGADTGARQGAGPRAATADTTNRAVPPAGDRRDRPARLQGAGGPDSREPPFMQQSGPEAADVQQSGAEAADGAAGARGSRTVALGLSPQALARKSIHALVVRDVPAGAHLSAGAYDPALDGWVIRPQDLDALTILVPPELRADFTVRLMAMARRADDAKADRVLAWLPVRLA